MCVCFATHHQFSDTSWVSYNSTQFNTVYPDSTGEGLSPTRLSLLQMPVTSPGCYLCFWPTGYKSEVPMTPSLDSINLLEWFTELRKPVYSLDYQFVTKGYEKIQINSLMKRYIGQGPQQRSVCSMELGANTVACGSILVHLPRSSLNPVLLGFMKTSLHRHNWLNCWPLVIELNLQTLSLPRNQGVRLKVPTV